MHYATLLSRGQVGGKIIRESLLWKVAFANNFVFRFVLE